MGLKLYPRPKNVPESWKLILCKSYLSQRYLSLENSKEYVVVKPPERVGNLPYLINRTEPGFANAKWFDEIVPELETLIKDPSIGYLFSRKFNSTVNELFAKQRPEKGMTPGQVQAINLFFEKYVPGIEGICPTCFNISLPNSGAGERWTYRNNDRYEVRLSAAKPDACYPHQQIEYVTHRELDQNQKVIYATWSTQNKVKGFDQNIEQEATHISWNIYDFKKFNIGMPGCNCQKK